MCGFVGFLGGKGSPGAADGEALLKRMADAISHRGPDDAGYWSDPGQRIGLGHRRLSILDLSPAGHQPMHSDSGRFVTVFNGEIYNYAEVRSELESLRRLTPGTQQSVLPLWRGHSDTEVMLAAFEQWGLEAAIKRFTGMFAIALWDRRERVLSLVRDRLGEKPLYYGWLGDTFLFASELKALRTHPQWRGKINRNALALLMRHNYIPTPYSIYDDIYKLTPGSIVKIRIGDKNAVPEPYWSAKEIAESGVSHPFAGNAAEAAELLEGLLRGAIAKQMVADVPLGAFLSGGIDSSTIVALMQAQSARPVRTFTIGFHEKGYNEAAHAKAVAQHLGTDHTELYVTPEEAMAVIPRLPALYDEPFSDSSQIPTFLVSQLARRQVTVSLSGDAGDELFGGYNRYFLGRSIWRKIGWMPQAVRRTASKLMTSVSPAAWDGFLGKVGLLVPVKALQRAPGDQVYKLAEILSADSPDTMYQRLVSHWKNPTAVVLGSSEPPTKLTDRKQWASLPDFTERMMYQDTVSYLPDDILVKVDRASMGVSLESRVPFLDHAVVEFAWKLPLSMKIRNGQGKWLLRQVLYKYVPRELVERPKTGFGIPIDSWLRGPLRDWAESLLDEGRLRRECFFDPAPIRQKWLEHLSGRRNWQYHLWDVLMFQAWFRENAEQ